MTQESSAWWPADDEPVGKRVVRYEIAIQRCAYIGAGYGGVFLLAGLAGERLFSSAPWWVEPTLASVITLGIVMLGWAYLRFTWCLRELRLKDPASQAGGYPRGAHWVYLVSIMVLVLATAIVLVSTWIAASPQLSPPAQPAPSPAS